ncbi:MAG: ankyrin repeat domain-containing protein [Candidatus Aminicenantes bacterium]|jgi:7,8-dihydropterin-6-yl-methyl-4-(beta-D-ribofuranosyl)aminobenzene 5'-phosphate synthase
MTGFKIGFIILLALIGITSLSWTSGNIHEAIIKGDLDSVRTILEADKSQLEARSSDNFTPLLLASIHGKLEIARFLIEKGANIHAGDNESSTPLHNAAARGHLDIVSLLIDKGSRINQCDGNGMTALHFAASYGHPACAKLLLEKGANVNAREINGRSPLFFNVRQGNTEIFDLLLDKGALIDVANNFDRTPLLYALWGGHPDLARKLISKGADVNKKDTEGYTPLHQTCFMGRVDFARLLVEEGADLELTESNGLTPLQLATYHNMGSLAVYLVEAGADIQKADPHGDTALHGAAWHGNTKAVTALLDKGADINAKNIQTRTPLDYANMAGHSKAAEFLKGKGAKTSAEGIEKQGERKIPTSVGEGETKPIKMTVLYDNYVAAEGTKAEWGFSCLIQGTSKTILFDTGGNPDTFRHNVQKLAVDLNTPEAIVLSHEHWDHVGGLPVVLETNTKAPIYIPYGFPYDFIRGVEVKGAKPVPVNEAVSVCDNVYLTGQMGTNIKEQSLILNTPAGLIIVTGCSHQGIVNIVKKAKELLGRDVYLVFGGFHLMRHSEEQVNEIIEAFRELGVQKCGATHCTGDRAIQQFRDAYGDDYVEIGSGRVLNFGIKGLQ